MSTMQEVTMTVQVPVELNDAFLARVKEEKKPASHIILELMRNYSGRQENIDEEERSRRIYDVKEANASLRLEGYEIPAIEHIFDQLYIEGKITIQDSISLTKEYFMLLRKEDETK